MRAAPRRLPRQRLGLSAALTRSNRLSSFHERKGETVSCFQTSDRELRIELRRTVAIEKYNSPIRQYYDSRMED